MTIATAHIVSHYAQPKPRGLHWNPRPLRLAKKHPLPPLADRTSSAQPSTALSSAAQPVVRVQDEHHEERPLIEAQTAQGVEGQLGDGQPESLASGSPNSPTPSNPELPVTHVGISPEDFLRNALPATHTFAQPTMPPSNRLDVTPPHRLRPSSSLSNFSSGSNRSRPPSAMSTHGQIRRSSSRASGSSLHHGMASSPGASSS